MVVIVIHVHLHRRPRPATPQIDLAAFHPTYHAPMQDTFADLTRRYPVANLQKVLAFDRPGDESMGYATKNAIHLNRHWFSKPLDVLRRAAIGGRILRGAEGVAAWHDDMDEPRHVLTHEFGHLLADALPGYAAFARDGWLAATREPGLAASGYSLADPDEWFAETFAAAELGARGEQADRLMEFVHDA